MLHRGGGRGEGPKISQHYKLPKVESTLSPSYSPSSVHGLERILTKNCTPPPPRKTHCLLPFGIVNTPPPCISPGTAFAAGCWAQGQPHVWFWETTTNPLARRVGHSPQSAAKGACFPTFLVNIRHNALLIICYPVCRLKTFPCSDSTFLWLMRMGIFPYV